MAIYVGEVVTIIASATNPATQTVITDALAEVEFYAPGKSPARVPADRVLDHGPVPMTYDATVINKDGTTGAYIGYAGTEGWVGGKWSYKVTLSGSYDTWEYGSFALVA